MARKNIDDIYNENNYVQKNYTGSGFALGLALAATCLIALHLLGVKLI